MAFERAVLHDAVAVDGLAPAAPHAIPMILGKRPAWLRRVDVGVNIALGLMLVAHGS